MINYFKKNMRNIVPLFIICIIALIILKIYNLFYYKMDLVNIPKKSLLGYKNLETDNSYIVSKFMKYVSDEDYQYAFELLNDNNRNDMFNNDAEEFMNKLNVFSNSYSKLTYNTIFSRELEDYIDEEIICMICNEEQIVEHSIRFNIRTYKSDKEASIIILNIN